MAETYEKVVRDDVTYYVVPGEAFAEGSPHVWKEKPDKKSGKVYYVNLGTADKKWSLPPLKGDAAAASSPTTGSKSSTKSSSAKKKSEEPTAVLLPPASTASGKDPFGTTPLAAPFSMPGLLTSFEPSTPTSSSSTKKKRASISKEDGAAAADGDAGGGGEEKKKVKKVVKKKSTSKSPKTSASSPTAADGAADEDDDDDGEGGVSAKRSSEPHGGLQGPDDAGGDDADTLAAPLRSEKKPSTAVITALSPTMLLHSPNDGDIAGAEDGAASSSVKKTKKKATASSTKKSGTKKASSKTSSTPSTAGASSTFDSVIGVDGEGNSAHIAAQSGAADASGTGAASSSEDETEAVAVSAATAAAPSSADGSRPTTEDSPRPVAAGRQRTVSFVDPIRHAEQGPTSPTPTQKQPATLSGAVDGEDAEREARPASSPLLQELWGSSTAATASSSGASHVKQPSSLAAAPLPASYITWSGDEHSQTGELKNGSASSYRSSVAGDRLVDDNGDSGAGGGSSMPSWISMRQQLASLGAAYSVSFTEAPPYLVSAEDSPGGQPTQLSSHGRMSYEMVSDYAPHKAGQTETHSAVHDVQRRATALSAPLSPVRSPGGVDLGAALPATGPAARPTPASGTPGVEYQAILTDVRRDARELHDDESTSPVRVAGVLRRDDSPEAMAAVQPLRSSRLHGPVLPQRPLGGAADSATLPAATTLHISRVEGRLRREDDSDDEWANALSTGVSTVDFQRKGYRHYPQQQQQQQPPTTGARNSNSTESAAAPWAPLLVHRPETAEFAAQTQSGPAAATTSTASAAAKPRAAEARVSVHTKRISGAAASMSSHISSAPRQPQTTARYPSTFAPQRLHQELLRRSPSPVPSSAAHREASASTPFAVAPQKRTSPPNAAASQLPMTLEVVDACFVRRAAIAPSPPSNTAPAASAAAAVPITPTIPAAPPAPPVAPVIIYAGVGSSPSSSPQYHPALTQLQQPLHYHARTAEEMTSPYITSSHHREHEVPYNPRRQPSRQQVRESRIACDPPQRSPRGGRKQPTYDETPCWTKRGPQSMLPRRRDEFEIATYLTREEALQLERYRAELRESQERHDRLTRQIAIWDEAHPQYTYAEPPLSSPAGSGCGSGLATSVKLMRDLEELRSRQAALDRSQAKTLELQWSHFLLTTQSKGRT